MKVGEWVREPMPADWNIARIKDHARVVNGYPFDSKLFTASTGHPLVRIRDISNSETVAGYDGDWIPEAAIANGDILVGMDGDFNVARWKGGNALLNQRVCCIRTTDRIDPGYVYYALPAPLRLINEFTYATTVKHLSSFDVLDICLPRPPIDQQKLIANYLDRETARIDALIADKERMLALLEEKRTALVSRVVTRGLDPDAPMKPSGLEWLGEIPAHWTTCQLKRTWASSDYGLSESIRDEGDISVLRMSCIVDGRIDITKSGRIAEADESLFLRKSDLLFNRTNSLDQIAKVGLVNFAPDEPLTFASYLVRLRANVRATPEYLTALLNASLFLLFARKNAIPAIGQANLSPTRYGDIHIPLPPLPEQEAIVAFLDKDNEKSVPLRGHIEQSIHLLKERRAALITAAVTGQIPPQDMTR